MDEQPRWMLCTHWVCVIAEETPVLQVSIGKPAQTLPWSKTISLLSCSGNSLPPAQEGDVISLFKSSLFINILEKIDQDHAVIRHGNTMSNFPQLFDDNKLEGARKAG